MTIVAAAAGKHDDRFDLNINEYHIFCNMHVWLVSGFLTSNLEIIMEAVFPRDAFNYAKLWKSLGFVMLAIHDGFVFVKGGNKCIPESFKFEKIECEDALNISQDPGTAYLSVSGIEFTCGGHSIQFEQIYNCKEHFGLLCTAIDGDPIDPVSVLEPMKFREWVIRQVLDHVVVEGAQFTREFYDLLRSLDKCESE